MSANDRSGLAGQWLVIGAIALFLVFAGAIASIILGIGPFAGGSSGPSDASAGVESGAETGTVPTGISSESPTTSRSTTERTATERTAPSTNERTASTSTRGSPSTVSDGFNTLTSQSSGATTSPTESTDETRVTADSVFTSTQSDSSLDSTASSSETDGGTARNTADSATYSNEDFSTALQAENIRTEEVFTTEGIVSGARSTTVLEYTTQVPASDRRNEASVVAEVYASAVDSGYQPEALSVTVYTANDDPVATYTIRREWASAYANGRISAEEYGRRIGNTYRSY